MNPRIGWRLSAASLGRVAACDKALVLCLVLGPISSHGQVYPKIEASFNLTNVVSDPFDYTQTDVRVQLAQPGGVTNSFLAFFDGGTTWRVRHSPTVQGGLPGGGRDFERAASGGEQSAADVMDRCRQARRPRICAR
jgi:hypothetical protein